MESFPEKRLPHVSVVIPCHDSMAYLPDTLESVMRQDFTGYEVIVVDDGSNDGIDEYVEPLVRESIEVPVVFIRQTQRGLASARNAGVAAARGRYILPLDADDLLTRDMLRDCSAVLDANPSIDIACTAREDFGDVQGIHAAGQFTLDRLKYFNQVSYCSLYRKSLWSAIGGYRVNVSGFDDWDFWIAAASRGSRAEAIDKPHFRHRRRATSLMWSLLSRYELLYSQIVLNNRCAYAPMEIEMALRHLQDGVMSPIASKAKFIFLQKYYRDYPTGVGAT